MAYHVRIEHKGNSILNIGILSETGYNSLFPAMETLAKQMNAELVESEIEDYDSLYIALGECEEDFNL